jgi:hypothetical protein
MGFRIKDLSIMLPYFTFGNTKRIVHYTFGTPASGKRFGKLEVKVCPPQEGKPDRGRDAQD